MKVHKVTAGHYRTDTGLDILREDVPSLAEWDVPSGDVTWYVLTTREADQGQALPDAMFEAPTLAECKAWAETWDHCTWVNVLCPDDLCVLPYGHPFTRQRRHITSTRLGSVNSTPAEQLAYLRDPAVTGFDRRYGYMEKRGTPKNRLIFLGVKMQEADWEGEES